MWDISKSPPTFATHGVGYKRSGISLIFPWSASSCFVLKSCMQISDGPPFETRHPPPLPRLFRKMGVISLARRARNPTLRFPLQLSPRPYLHWVFLHDHCQWSLCFSVSVSPRRNTTFTWHLPHYKWCSLKWELKCSIMCEVQCTLVCRWNVEECVNVAKDGM